jgi:hypothetical protein
VLQAVNSLFTRRSKVVEQMQSAMRNNKNNLDVTKQTQVVITSISSISKSKVCLKVAEVMQEECINPACCY